MVFSKDKEISSLGALLLFYSDISWCLKHAFLFTVYFYYIILQNQIIFSVIIVI